LGLVFTNGLLIQIAPEDIPTFLDEIYRRTRRFIWGMECYSKEYTKINYRGYNDLLWKTDFPRLFLGCFKDLEVVKERFFK